VSQSDFVHRGQALVSAGQYQEAVKVCRLGLLGRPTTVEGRIVLGQALLALKRYDEVLAEMRVALELDHQAVAAHALKGEALLRKGDRHAAIETLERAKTIAPEDKVIIRLLTEAERVPGGFGLNAAQSSAGFGGDTGTRNYLGSSSEDEETGDGYTRPQSPSSKQRQVAAPERNGNVRGTPSEAMLDVGDRSGTVEVDPDLEAVELDGGAPLTPPRAQQVQDFEAARGKVSRSRRDKPTQQQRPKGGSQPMPIVEKASPLTRQPRGNAKDNVVELDSEDVVALDDDSSEDFDSSPSGSPSRVRAAVNLPSGPLAAPPGPASLAQAIAKAPHVIEMMPLSPSAQMKATQAGVAPMPVPSSARAAAVPNAPMPAMPPSMPPPQPFVAPLPGWPPPAPMGTVPPTMPPTMMPSQPVIAALAPTIAPPPQIRPAPQGVLGGSPLDSGVVAVVATPVGDGSRDVSRSGTRRSRSKLAIVVWIVVGAGVIGGGVFAGFQIRAMRLAGQIDAARDRAVEQAQPDTWIGWTAARDSLASIAQAQNTPENRAALARVKALLAYELGDSVPDAKASVEALKGAPGLDADIAAAYVALAYDDVKTAKLHADAAVSEGSSDPEAGYVAGLAQVLGGDYATGIATLQTAVDQSQRALPAVSLARAQAEIGAWDPALATLDKALKAFPDHPALVIARARILVLAGRIAPTSANSAEIRAGVEKVISEGGKPVAEQPRGVSPAQLAFATLVQVRVEFARANVLAEQAALRTLLSVAVDDDQRFAEETVETFAAIGEAASARSAAERALAIWPQSRRATIALARLELAAGAPAQALDTLKKVADATSLLLGLVTRAEARLATGDVDGARADYQNAVKRLPSYEPAVVGLVALDLRGNDLAGAKALVERAVTATPTPAIVVAYASVVRTSHDLAGRDKAKTMLEKAVKTASGPDLTGAQLELAKIDRDEGNLRGARDLFAEASKTGNLEARLESALLVGESAPIDGRDSLERLVKEVAPNPPANLLVELGRARMLVGDHDAADQALDAADKAFAPNAPRWSLDRERGRLAFRRGDLPGAAALLDRALDNSGDDAETFLLAADVAATDLAVADAKTPPRLTAFADKLRKLAAARLAGRPEALIVTGILALAAGKDADAQDAYTKANALVGKQAVSTRIQARIQYGLAVLAYNAKNTTDAKAKLEYVFALEPANYSAYLFAIEVIREFDPKTALGYAQTVVRLNPASVYGWYYLGVLGKKDGQDKLLADAIAMVNTLAPTSDLAKELVALKH
jgi:tetratricopeptide (TPR) repeat protein